MVIPAGPNPKEESTRGVKTYAPAKIIAIATSLVTIGWAARNCWM